MYELYLTIGRWGSDTVKVEDINDATLYTAVQSKLKECPDGPLMATQVLIWCDNGRTHNLIAVYDMQGRKVKAI